jgi:hypothetical protein
MQPWSVDWVRTESQPQPQRQQLVLKNDCDNYKERQLNVPNKKLWVKDRHSNRRRAQLLRLSFIYSYLTVNARRHLLTRAHKSAIIYSACPPPFITSDYLMEEASTQEAFVSTYRGRSLIINSKITFRFLFKKLNSIFFIIIIIIICMYAVVTTTIVVHRVIIIITMGIRRECIIIIEE